jgi:uncharacterized protein (UPF0261 family)
MSVYLIATLDTKGTELAFVARKLAEWNMPTVTVDVGVLGQPLCAADISREDVFAAAGVSLSEIQQQQDRGTAIARAAQGAVALVSAAQSRGEVTGVLSLGGSAGTTIGTAVMRAMPLGLPKLMVSTLAAGPMRSFVGGSDILVLNSVVDIAGLNRISTTVLHNAAAAMAGLVQHRPRPVESTAAAPSRPVIAATMFGVTTPCVERARQQLEHSGYEVLVFHATGTGGEAMEGLIRDGWITAVLDLTTTELADELVGGILSAGPDRLTAAGRAGIPQVLSVGALDMVNFGPRATVPESFSHRRFHQHNAHVTLMRTTELECRELGRQIGERAAAARGPVTILFPTQGISALDAPGRPFHDPTADEALWQGILETCQGVTVRRVETHINEPAFADACVTELLLLLSTNP